MLWLLLLSGGIAKWAALSPLKERALGGAQLALSSAVAFVLISAVALNGINIVRNVKVGAAGQAAVLSVFEDSLQRDELAA